MNSIKTRRLKIKITQEELAKHLGIKKSTVSKWETGDSLPRAELLPRLASKLNCTIDELLTE